MIIKDMLKRKQISTRLYNVLKFAYRNKTNINVRTTSEAYLLIVDSIYEDFGKLEFVEVLNELNISKASDISKYRNAGKTLISELENLMNQERIEHD